MNKKQRWVFTALVLFPFALAMTFRTIDNYSFHQKIDETRAKRSKEEQTESLRINDECTEFFRYFNLQSIQENQ